MEPASPLTGASKRREICPDPAGLAAAQLARDRAFVTRFPGLLERKLERLLASPLGYLRGTAPLFYGLLAEFPSLAAGPAGEGWLSGDAHLENFGVFRTDAGKASSPDSDVTFDVNDFDETIVGPFRFDVLRLVTSLLLGARGLGATGPQAIDLAMRLVESYAAAAFGGTVMPATPRPVSALIDKACRRSHRDLLEGRTTLTDGRRRFIRGDRYADLPLPLMHAACDAFARYAQALPGAERNRDRFEILDAAFRIAGTGSLGSLRIAVLTRGKSDEGAGWLFDMKEERIPSATVVARAPEIAPAARVVAGVRACLASPPRMMGTTDLDGLSLFVRRLTPQEDKLAFAEVAPGDLEGMSRYLGALLGRAHSRGAQSLPAVPWTAQEQREIVENAILLTGLHEACYLSLAASAR